MFTTCNQRKRIILFPLGNCNMPYNKIYQSRTCNQDDTIIKLLQLPRVNKILHGLYDDPYTGYRNRVPSMAAEINSAFP